MTILVAGLINIEITLRVEAFPIYYNPVNYPFFGVNSSVSGVGYNVAKALTVLGNDLSFLSLIGRDAARTLVRETLLNDCIPGDHVLDILDQTPHSVILYDKTGRRQINVDLKDIQERTYPPDIFEAALAEASLVVPCNVNFSRAFLRKAWQAGKPVATDVHAIADLEDAYNGDYMRYASVLFMSHEKLPTSPEQWARQIMNRYGTEIIVIGLGADGALLSVKSHRFLERIPAVDTRPVVNTIGAGDALFSAFVHIYHRTRNPYEAIRKAMVFASYKIGSTSAADGFLSAEQLDALYTSVTRKVNGHS
ncbi:MAG: carbohydrate kinase family protein [Chloroflexi bacterium]|nr:carbohydrate kinase family protein [Chloroflexota bacterium]